MPGEKKDGDFEKNGYFFKIKHKNKLGKWTDRAMQEMRFNVTTIELYKTNSGIILDFRNRKNLMQKIC